MSLPDASTIPSTSFNVIKPFCCAAYGSAVGNLSDGAGGKSGDDPVGNNYATDYSKQGVGSYTVQQAGSATPYMAMLKATYPNGVNAVTGTVGWLPFGKEHTYEPMKLPQITAAGVPLSEFWEVGDYDLLATGGDKYDLAISPVHKTIRNFVYFDGHAGNRKVTAAGTYDQ